MVAVVAGIGLARRQFAFVYRSIDGGRNMERSSVPCRSDRPFLNIDTVSQKFRRRVYLQVAPQFDAKTSTNAMAVFHSGDGGATFSPFVFTPIFLSRRTWEG